MDEKSVPIAEAAGPPHPMCAPLDIEIAANRKGITAYAATLHENAFSSLVAIRFEQKATGVAHVVTEVRAGGDPDVLHPLYDAELAAHDAARSAGGTAPFVFDIIDLDVETERQLLSSYETIA